MLATLAGGCFWCTEAAFEQLAGVVSVLPGYMGGHDPAPTYEAVCRGGTGHAEVVQIAFDPVEHDTPRAGGSGIGHRRLSSGGARICRGTGRRAGLTTLAHCGQAAKRRLKR